MADIAIQEALSLAPVHLGSLPLPCTLRLVLRPPGIGVGVEWHVTTCAATHATLSMQRAAVFTGRELGCMAIAAENGRASSEALGRWLASRRARSLQPLSVTTALGGVQDAQMHDHRWPLSRVLLHWSSELVEVT